MVSIRHEGVKEEIAMVISMIVMMVMMVMMMRCGVV